MKRKDGSSSDESRTTSKKSLQFVGILNGGWVKLHSSREKIVWRLTPWSEHHRGFIEQPHVTSTLSPRYESTSSEEEEDEEEEDGSSSDQSGDGECLDSTEDEAVLDEDTSEDERNVNLDESDTDEETMRDTSSSSEAVKEKCVLSAHTPSPSF